MRTIDMTGKRCGKLSVIRFSHNQAYGGRTSRATWLCRCDCGNETLVAGVYLRRGEVQSCGCLKAISMRATALKHGLARVGRRHHLYSTWKNIRVRCSNPNCANWHRYGGRGIKLCDRWNSFANFVSDMGPSWKPGLSIHRVNNDGDYEPSNCVWADDKTQANNGSRNRYYPFGGGLKTVSEIARETGIHKDVLYNRLRRGWDPNRTFHEPVNKDTSHPRVVA